MAKKHRRVDVPDVVNTYRDSLRHLLSVGLIGQHEFHRQMAIATEHESLSRRLERTAQGVEVVE